MINYIYKKKVLKTMKTIFMHAPQKLEKVEFDVSGLPSNIGLVTTIQYLKEIEKVKDFLETKGKNVIIGGQVLGCDQTTAERIAQEVDCFLYVGTGRFHPLGVAYKTGKPVYVLHPKTMLISEFEANVEAYKKKKQGMKAKFYSSKTIGVLMTTKKGQSRVQVNPERYKEIEKQFPDKKYYYFLSDTLNYSELENFKFIECWVNTMCPRIMDDINVLNIEDILEPEQKREN